MVTVLVKNDKLFDLNFTVKDSSGTAVNLTDVTTITFKMKKFNSATNKVSRACNVVSAVAGTCKVTLQAADTDTAGVYQSEIQLLYVDGKILTAQLDDIQIVDDLVNS